MTLDYKLCKELKDAGFPQDDIGECGEKHYHIKDKMSCNYPYVPQLSELIDACGDDFHDLEYQKGNWRKGEWCAGSKSKISVFGKTPEEAVARLYLRLKK